MDWDAFNLPPQDAINWFKDRVPVTTDEWIFLNQDARAKAFFISGTAQLDLIGETHTSLRKALEEGKSFADWKKEMQQKLENGWTASGAPGLNTTAQVNNRLETIYQTNIQHAYQAGRYRQMTDPDVLALRPMWVYVAVMDSRTSHTCKRLNNTTLPHDDPFWQKNHPPRHFRCRSTIRSLPADTKPVAGPAGVQADPGFGTPPKPAEWAGEISKGVASGAAARTWTPAFDGNAPTPLGYGLPPSLPKNPIPATAPVERAVLSDPLETSLIFNPEVATGAVDRARDVIVAPTEIWLYPVVSDKGTVVYRQRHLKLYDDGELVVVESHRGVVIRVLMEPAETAGKYRQGFLRHPQT